ncbi:MAG TPA: phosphatase PAP2 family protein [Polyangiaceae bacterium]|nr:phosphatase PAP2 family protein [Polyangiaceae bacterium]
MAEHRLPQRMVTFVKRHPWSLSLSVGATAGFVRLASEVQERELDAFDAAVAGAVTAWRGKLDQPMVVLTWLGGAGAMTFFAASVVLLLAVLRKRREAMFLAVCALGALLLNTTLKLFFQRARPDAVFEYLVAAPTSFSFPSGHAMCSMGVVAALVVVARALGAPRVPWIACALIALIFACGVALSRVYLGVHYPSDVIAGLLAGGAWVSAVTGWFYPRLLPGEESGTPEPSGGAGSHA